MLGALLQLLCFVCLVCALELQKQSLELISSCDLEHMIAYFLWICQNIITIYSNSLEREIQERKELEWEATLEKQQRSHFAGARRGGAAVVAVARQAGTCPAEARADTRS